MTLGDGDGLRKRFESGLSCYYYGDKNHFPVSSGEIAPWRCVGTERVGILHACQWQPETPDRWGTMCPSWRTLSTSRISGLHIDIRLFGNEYILGQFMNANIALPPPLNRELVFLQYFWFLH